MKDPENHKSARSLILRSSMAATALLCSFALTSSTQADDEDAGFQPGHLLVSRVVYDNNPNNVVAGATVLPPGCISQCAKAIADGTYPQVWNNASVDASFGIT